MGVSSCGIWIPTMEGVLWGSLKTTNKNMVCPPKKRRATPYGTESDHMSCVWSSCQGKNAKGKFSTPHVLYRWTLLVPSSVFDWETGNSQHELRLPGTRCSSVWEEGRGAILQQPNNDACRRWKRARSNANQVGELAGISGTDNT